MTSFYREKKMETTSGFTEPVILKRQLHTLATIAEIYTEQSEPPAVCDLIKRPCNVSLNSVGRHVLNFIPFMRLLKTYQWRSWILADIISGLSVGFMHLPQGLGAGFLSSLNPANGLYTTFFPILVYVLFGTSPFVSMGSNGLISLLTANLVDREAANFRSSLGVNGTWTSEEELRYKVGIAAASCFVSGLILLAMGLLRLGFITNFLAKSFTGGFTFSVAVHICTKMVVEMLIKTQNHSGFGKLVLTYFDLFKNITDISLANVIVGMVCTAVLLAAQIGVNERYRHKLKMAIPIDLIVVVVSTFISHFADLHDRFGVRIFGDVPTGLPAPSLPDMASIPRVAADAFITAILILALTISLCKLTAQLHDITIDDNQEMVAYGMCSLVGAFFQNIPACIGPPRTMLLSSLGAKTTLNGVVSGVFVFVVLLVAGQLFASLPIATLAAMIVVAIKDLLLQIRDLKYLWNVNKSDFFIWVVTAVVSVLGDLDIGLLVGVVFSMITVLVVGQMARGTLLGKARDEDLLLEIGRKGICPIPGVIIFRFGSALCFASQERFRHQLYTLVMNPTAKRPSTFVDFSSAEDPLRNSTAELDLTADSDRPISSASSSEKEVRGHVTHHVILECSAMIYIDVAGVDVLKLVLTQFSRADVDVWLADVPAGTLGTLQRAGFVDSIGRHRIFYSVVDALHQLQQM